MSFRRDLYERVMHQKDFGKVKNKIYDILGWFVDYSMSTVIAMEFPIGKGFFETIADTHLVEVKECEQIDFERIGNSNMKMDKVANSGNDEFYTPLYAIKPIVKYLKPNSTIWCPFDTEQSLFVKYFREMGHTVIATHIQSGTDFFDCDIPNCDYIISNPPYSVKGKVFERLFEIGKPFAMLVGVAGLFESQQRFNLFKNNDFEIMYFNKRVSYFKDYADEKPNLNPTFSSVYVCNGILPKQIVFEEIEK